MKKRKRDGKIDRTKRAVDRKDEWKIKILILFQIDFNSDN